MAGRPPRAGVWMVRFSGQDPAEAMLGSRERVIVELELVHALEVEAEGAGGSVHFECQRVLRARSESGRLEGGQGAVVCAGDDDDSVIYGDVA